MAGKPFRARSQAMLRAKIAERELVFRPISAVQAMRLGPVTGPVLQLVDALRLKRPATEAVGELVATLCEHPLLAGAIVLDALRDMELEDSNPGKPADVDDFLRGIDAVVLGELLAAVVTVNLMGAVPFAMSLPGLIGQAQVTVESATVAAPV